LNKEYSRLRKYKYKAYQKHIMDQIQGLHDNNPKLYWKLLDDMRSSERSDQSSNVAPSTWISHFESLYQPHESFKDRLVDELESLEKIPCFNNLNNNITDKEIIDAISKLHGNKSPDLDNISNNMIKHSQSFLIASFKKLFNSCLANGLYHRNWSEGYITVLLKSGDVADPNNYRGLTITNAFGKLFN
jgi:hypothetical protein